MDSRSKRIKAFGGVPSQVPVFRDESRPFCAAELCWGRLDALGRPFHRCCVLRLRGALWGTPLPSPLTHPHCPASRQGARGARSCRGRAGPSGGEGLHRARAARAGPPGDGTEGLVPSPCPLLSLPLMPRKTPPVHGHFGSTVEHGDPCPWDIRLVDRQTAVSTPRGAATCHQREGLS